MESLPRPPFRNRGKKDRICRISINLPFHSSVIFTNKRTFVLLSRSDETKIDSRGIQVSNCRQLKMHTDLFFTNGTLKLEKSELTKTIFEKHFMIFMSGCF